MKIIDSLWFNELGSIKPIGIVTVKDETTGEIKHFIGTGHGIDRQLDEKKIMEKGAKYRREITNQILEQAEKRGNIINRLAFHE